MFIIKITVLHNLFSSDYFFNKLRVYDYLDNILESIIIIINDNKNLNIEINIKDEYLKVYNYMNSILNIEDHNFKVIVSNRINEENVFSFYNGLILKLKVNICFDDYYKIESDYKMKNILLYESDVSLNIKFIEKFLEINKIVPVSDENECMIKFIEKLIEMDINIIFTVGTNVSYELKQILYSYSFIHIEWLNSKNYQVLK